MRCRSFLGVTAHNIDNTRVLSTFQAILGTGRLSLGRLAAAWRKIWTNTQFSISPFKMFKSFCLPTSLTRLGCLFLSWNPNQSISCNLRITRSMKYPQTILSWCKITKLWLDQSEGVRTQLTGVGSSFTAFMSCISSFRRLSFLVLGKWHKIRRWHNPGHNKRLLQQHYTIQLHLHKEQHLDRKANHQKGFYEPKLQNLLSRNLG